MSGVAIKQVEDQKQLNQFIMLPWKIYKGDRHWVPPLLMDLKKLLDKKKNPFFKHSDADYFIAEKNGAVVGRIAAILNNAHNEFHNEQTGFFGFFECIHDVEVAQALIDRAQSWCRGKSLSSIRGPMNFTTNDTCGMLCDGFDYSPVIMMPYNPKYYLDLMQNCGLQKIKELYAYKLHKNTPLPDRFIAFAEKLKQDETLTFRNFNLKDFDNEVKIVQSIYNDAWQDNWGFVPLNDEEFKHAAKDLKMAVDPDIVFIAEVNGEPAGFSLALPDFNEIFKTLNGRLLPFGIFKLLLKKSSIQGIRVVTLGVKQKFQKKRGLAPAFYYETYTRGIQKGYSVGEFSWILEDNTLMNRALEGLGTTLYKRYAVFEASI